MEERTPRTQERARQYFCVKARQLAAICDLPICEHPGLIGSHREEIYRIYLREILPKRFGVGRGMVYGLVNRSKEADIIIWDAQNFPSLPMSDHSFFFAESVRVVLESKSIWNSEEFTDVLTKSRAIRDIGFMSGPTLADELAMILQELAAIREGRGYEGMLIARHHIGTAAIFIKGGQSLTNDYLTDEIIDDADDSWPDLLLFLEPGRLIVKNYQATGGIGGTGWLEFYELGEDALLAFTNGLLSLLAERSVQSEEPLYLSKYAPDVASINPTSTIKFPIRRPVPQRTPLWR
jgi:hypothetical protein